MPTYRGAVVARKLEARVARQIEPLIPDAEDFASAESAAGPLHEENGSPTEARARYEVAQAHKLVRLLKDTAQRIRERSGAATRPSKRK